MRYFLEIAYNGAAYHGWQLQQNALSVQQVLTEALSTIFREEVYLMGSGRTDKGVHAEQQFVHFDAACQITEEKYLYPINAILPPDISVKRIYEVKPEAHARFSALDRSYEYRMARNKNPFLTGISYINVKPLDFEVMNEAAAFLLSKNMPEGLDYACFSRIKTGAAHFKCKVIVAEWKQYKVGTFSETWVFHITANRFLRGMVRAVVGTLMEVGKHTITIAEFQEILNSRNRRKAGPALDPGGLFLTNVRYPKEIFTNEK